MAEAKVNPGTERDMSVRPPRQIEFLGIGVCLRIQICGRDHRHDFLALLQPDTTKFHILADYARFGELDR